MERVFRRLKAKWRPQTGCDNLDQAKSDADGYLMGYYNYQSMNSFNQSLALAVAEKKVLFNILD